MNVKQETTYTLTCSEVEAHWLFTYLQKETIHIQSSDRCKIHQRLIEGLTPKRPYQKGDA